MCFYLQIYTLNENASPLLAETSIFIQQPLSSSHGQVSGIPKIEYLRLPPPLLTVNSMKSKWLFILLFLLLSNHLRSFAQSEFPKGWIFPLELSQGAVTAFDHTPDLYLASIAFSPQVAVIPGRLRLGVTGGGAFTNKRIYGIGGGRLSLLIWGGPKVIESTVLNVQLVGEHLWGTKDQRLVGGGIAAEIGTIATISIKSHRDYMLNSWWFQATLGINLFRKKIAPPPVL